MPLTPEKLKKIEEEEQYRLELRNKQKQSSVTEKTYFQEEQKTPWWKPKGAGIWGCLILVIIIFGIPSVYGLFSSSSNNNEQKKNTETKQAELDDAAKDFHSKGEKLNDDVGNSFLTGDTIYSKTHLENIGDESIELHLTVKDDWYYLSDYQQERLLNDAWEKFNALTVKNGLRQEDDMPWKVIFLDQYDKRLGDKWF